MNLKEKENLFQAVFVVGIVLLKRFYGSLLGEYENVLFVFTAAIGLFAINWFLKRVTHKGETVDGWEDKWDLATFLIYGVALLILQWLNADNIWLMIIVGALIIGINVIIKVKRRAIKRDMNNR